MASDAYRRELEAIREASRIYDAARKAYHAGQLTDDEFLAALATYKEAEARFDVAYLKEQTEG